MNAKKIVGDDLVKELIKTLKLPKGTKSIELRVAVDELVEVKCKYFAETDKEELTMLMGKYTLHKK